MSDSSISQMCSGNNNCLKKCFVWNVKNTKDNQERQHTAKLINPLQKKEAKLIEKCSQQDIISPKWEFNNLQYCPSFHINRKDNNINNYYYV